MREYTLKIFWNDGSETIAVTKDFNSSKEARKWAKLCLDICGRSVLGSLYDSAVLTCKVEVFSHE